MRDMEISTCLEKVTNPDSSAHESLLKDWLFTGLKLVGNG